METQKRIAELEEKIAYLRARIANMRKLTDKDVEFRISVEQDYLKVRGNAMASVAHCHSGRANEAPER